MNVQQAQEVARNSGRYYAILLADEVDRLGAQLESVRTELAATVAIIAAWDDVLADVIPVLHEQMGND